jgi:hypothetical protein
MIAWDDALVVELAARRCLVFLGSGASAGCVAMAGGHTPPTWPQLLSNLRDRIGVDHEHAALAQDLIDRGRLLEAAEVLHSSMTHAAYSHAMRQIFEVPRFQPSEIHKAVLAIDPKVVVTTNFDTVYDRYCTSGRAANGYNVIKYHDDHLLAELRSPIRCVIKAHGCITNADRMVLTKAQFFDARQREPGFYKVLDALFLTHTILFVGYSLSDPDIQLTLENANIAASSARKHYFVTEAGTNPALRQASERAYNISFVEFPAGNFACLEASLHALARQVEAYRQENPEA